jgi:hypothetical protein
VEGARRGWEKKGIGHPDQKKKRREGETTSKETGLLFSSRSFLSFTHSNPLTSPLGGEEEKREEKKKNVRR